MEIWINYNIELNPNARRRGRAGYGFKIKNKIFYKTKGENVMKKMNNKGFSLVELIVVVLIMAIIAVALAPQVMKWVENSRLSTDCETYDGLIANIQVALTDKSAYAEQKPSTADAVFDISNTGTTLTGTASDLSAALAKVNPSWQLAKSKVSGAIYRISITADGTTINVSRTSAPDTYSNTDLN